MSSSTADAFTSCAKFFGDGKGPAQYIVLSLYCMYIVHLMIVIITIITIIK